MHLAAGWETAAGAAAVLAVVAWALRAVTWGGALAGVAVGAAVAAGFGAPGLIVLGAFFVAGTIATRVGYAAKAARGTAEATGGSRGAARVVGKGGVAAALALAAVAGVHEPVAYCGAVAAALADTLGTEIGSLSKGAAWRIPQCVRVTHGTRGAVSIAGLAGAAAGCGIVLGAAVLSHLPVPEPGGWPRAAAAVLAGGFLGSVLESLVVGIAPPFARTPGWVRNVFTTAAGAAIAYIGVGFGGFGGGPR